MKTLFLALIMTFVFGSAVSAEAQTNQELRLRVGQQKNVSRGTLKIRFISLVEDSRCPEGTNCVWAGNAKIQVKITDSAGRAESFELNTNLGAKGASFGGYAINLTGLTPSPRTNIRINRNGYTATLSVSKLKR